MKKISLLFCLIILQAGLLCGCRLPHKSSPQKPVEGENKSGLVKVQDDKKEEKKEEKEKEKEVKKFVRIRFKRSYICEGGSRHESTVVRQIINISIGSQYFLLLVEVDVHQTGFAVVHNLADNLQCFIFFACRTGESPCQCHRFGIGTEHFAYYRLGNRCFRFDGQLRQIGVRLHIAEVLVDGGNHFIRIEITRQTDGHIVGHIPSFIIILDVGDGRIL